MVNSFTASLTGMWGSSSRIIHLSRVLHSFYLHFVFLLSKKHNFKLHDDYDDDNHPVIIILLIIVLNVR